MTDADFKCDGLDEFTKKLFYKFEKKYPDEAKAFIQTNLRKSVKVAKSNTPRRVKGKSSGTWKKWRYKAWKKPGCTVGKIELRSRKGHLIEYGHVDYHTGRFIPGAHMLEKTMAVERPRIDNEIEKLIDKLLDI